jgi:hypothetical protein
MLAVAVVEHIQLEQVVQVVQVEVVMVKAVQLLRHNLLELQTQAAAVAQLGNRLRVATAVQASSSSKSQPMVSEAQAT